MSGTWERLAGLELEIEGYTLEPLSAQVSSEFERQSTVMHLHGGGEEGCGEDVTYDAVDHEHPAGRRARRCRWPAATRWRPSRSACASWSSSREPPQREVSRNYRAWAYESAALDLALRQAGTTLHAVLGREPAPVRFVVSLRLGEPPTLEPVQRRLALHPGLRFKLDPTSSGMSALIARAGRDAAPSSRWTSRATTPARSSTSRPTRELYRRVAEALPDAWIEDPALTPETDAVLAAPPRRASPGTRRSTPSPTSKRCRTRRGW